MRTDIMIPNTQIPPPQWGAAERFGWLVAWGYCSPEVVVPLLCDAALRNGYRGDFSGLRCRLYWRVAETADAVGRRRSWAEYAIRRAVRPLIGREPSNVLLRAAQQVGTKEGGDLPDWFVVAIVEEEIVSTVRRAAYVRV
jgi:hypothetical protein